MPTTKHSNNASHQERRPKYLGEILKEKLMQQQMQQQDDDRDNCGIRFWEGIVIATLIHAMFWIPFIWNKLD